MRQSSIPNPLKLLVRRRINNLHTLAVLTNFFLFFFALPFSLQGAGQEKLGIYIKSVVKGGAADVVSPTTQGKKAGSWQTFPEGGGVSAVPLTLFICVHAGRPPGCRWPAVERGRAQPRWPVAREVNPRGFKWAQTLLNYHFVPAARNCIIGRRPEKKADCRLRNCSIVGVTLMWRHFANRRIPSGLAAPEYF